VAEDIRVAAGRTSWWCHIFRHFLDLKRKASGLLVKYPNLWQLLPKPLLAISYSSSI
jgi:hypothetical protein